MKELVILVSVFLGPDGNIMQYEYARFATQAECQYVARQRSFVPPYMPMGAVAAKYLCVDEDLGV